MLIGIMQGRLSNKPGMELQSFPWNSWEKEFSRAKKIGFKHIEWLHDDFDSNNPIMSASGRKKISNLSIKYEVEVKSLCVHSLMDGDLLKKGLIQSETIDKFSKLLNCALKANIDKVIIPIMDSMSIKKHKSKEMLKKILNEIINNRSPKILLESDLPAHEIIKFVDYFDSDAVGVVYDLGNATAMGFNIEEDITLLSPLIDEIHIKDRAFNHGSSLRLGQADTDFYKAFGALKKESWQGSVVLETPIFENWYEEAEANFVFIKNIAESVFGKIEGKI
jgi:sugar phosphate isomerase/epimerase